MDPLSFTASLIAVITLAGTVINSIKKLRTLLKDAPSDVLALLNEIEDFHSVLHSVQNTCQYTTSHTFHELSSLPSRASDKLNELEHLLHYRVLKRVPKQGAEAEVPKLRWLRVRGRINSLRKDLTSIRADLTTALATIIARQNQSLHDLTKENTAAVNTRLEKLEICMEDMCGMQEATSENIRAGVMALTALGNSRAKTTEFEPMTSIKSLAHSEGLNRPRDVLRITATTTTGSNCNPWCCCVCHKRQHWQTPSVLRRFLGNLLLGYSGALFSEVACSENMCRRSSAQTTKVSYRFPAWFAARMLMADIGGPSISLRVSRVVPVDAPIMQYARVGNADAIKSLIEAGMASPWDVDTDGWTPLGRAIEDSHLDACRFLLQAGADPKAEQKGNPSPTDIALSYAFAGNSIFYEILPLWDCIWEQDYTRLHKIILGIIPGDIEDELAISTVDINTEDLAGRTPLNWACYLCNNPAIEALLKYGADPKIQDLWGQTTLMDAASWSSPSEIDRLLRAGADLLTTDKDGKTALDWAEYYERKENIVCLMLHESELATQSTTYIRLSQTYEYNTSRIVRLPKV
ncbi:hypothetical protein MMC27_008277 [Xylographa pallens]|nr:hypothetical protein [Xylographa pallens]